MTRHASVLLLTLSAAIFQGVAPSSVSAQTFGGQRVSESSSSAPLGPRASSISGLFADTIDDFRKLPSVESATILSIGAASAALFSTLDREATNGLSTSNDMGALFHQGEGLGGARTQAAAALATYAIGRITNHPKTAAIGADLVSAQIVTQTATSVIKMAANRTRPDGTNYSFPSGHSATAFATATVLQRHLGWKIGAPAYGVAAYVAASRIQVKRHFLSDVAFGAALGVVAGRTVTVGRGDARFAVAPSAIPGGGAINFTWLDKK
jgi:membrane-associated phospholipid phosphatase